MFVWSDSSNANTALLDKWQMHPGCLINLRYPSAYKCGRICQYCTIFLGLREILLLSTKLMFSSKEANKLAIVEGVTRKKKRLVCHMGFIEIIFVLIFLVLNSWICETEGLNRERQGKPYGSPGFIDLTVAQP